MGVLNRFTTQPETVNRVNTNLYNKCNSNMFTTQCIEWVSALRESTHPDHQVIADNVLMSQFNKKDLKCAFPPDYITYADTNNLSRRECWYSECASAPTWKLLTNNIYNKQQCMFSECNISINDMNILNISDVNLKCNNSSATKDIKTEADELFLDCSNSRILYFNSLIYFILLIIFILMHLSRMT